MNIKICTPVIGNTLDFFLSNLVKTQEISNFIELRVDNIKNLSIKDIDIIRQKTNVSAILTCRSMSEGGLYRKSEGDRIRILQLAIGKFDYIDIELETVKNHHFNRNNKTKFIISYHNLKETPSFWEIQKIIYLMNLYHPDIIKIATMIQHDYEKTKIYRLLTNKPHNEERIAIGMGEKGKITRIVGPLLGSYLTYASTEWGETDQGQLEIEKLKRIYDSLSY